MYNIFLNNIKAARKLKTQKNIAEVSLSIFRMLIQHICISNAEYINILAKESPENMSKIDISFIELSQPADGTCVDFISNSLTQIAKLKNIIQLHDATPVQDASFRNLETHQLGVPLGKRADRQRLRTGKQTRDFLRGLQLRIDNHG